MNFSVTQYGIPLDPSKYNWDPKTKTFSTDEENLVIDFSDINGVTFKTGDNCTFKTGSYCTFKTLSDCTFKTEDYCTFDTGYNCTFKTGYSCTFNTGSYCTFNTGSSCTFKTEDNCTFKTGSYCTFTCKEDCVIVRRDVFEIIQPKPEETIKLNDFNVKGYTVVNPKRIISIDGKDIEISEESFNNLKEQLS